MAKTRISEYDSTANNNTDVASVNIDEGCAPSGINNAIRAVMAHLKDFQQGTNGDSFNGPHNGTVGATTPAAGTFTTLATTGNTTLGNDSGDVITINGTTTFNQSVSISSGSFNGAIGSTTPSTGAFTTLAASGAVTLSGGSANAVPYLNGSKVLTSGSALTFTGGSLNVTATDGVQVVGGGLSSYFYADAVGGNISVPGNNALRAYINGSEQMRLTSTGLGIGTSSPTQKLHISGGSSLVGVGHSYYTYTSDFGIGTPDSDQLQIFAGAGNGIRFGNRTSGTFTERARIDSSGNLLVGTTSNPYTGRIVGYGAPFVSHSTGTTATDKFYFVNGNGIVGYIQTNGSSTSYNTSSDYRLKNTIAPMTGALAKVAALKPCTYKWNADGSDGEGFIAHELAEVVPQCVTGEKDAVDADGNPVYQGIDTSFLVATLTAAIQELKAEFDAYKATHP